jgi:hypothetical protein
VYRDDRSHGNSQGVLDALGLSDHRGHLDDPLARPHLTPVDAQPGSAVLGIDQPDTARPDDQVVQVARPAELTPVVEDDEAPG